MTEAIGGLAIKVDLQVDPTKAAAQWARAADAAKASSQRVASDASAAQARAADESAARWESALGGLRNVVVGIATAAAGAMAALGASVFESALAIDRQARSLGVSTDEIQRMRYAAEQAGLEGNELGEAMGGLVSRVQAAADGGGDAARRFEEMGLAITDANGETLSADQLFRNAADSLQRMGPGTEQTAAAIALFGEKGRLLLPVLAQGSAGLNRMGAEFDELGGGLDADTIASVQRTRAEFERFKLSVMAEVMPAVRGFIEVVESFARKARPTIVAIREWFSDSHNLRTATIALTVAMGALGVASANAAAASIVAWAPVIATIGAIALGIAGVALVADDLITTFEGGDSVTRRFIDGLFGIGTAERMVIGLKASLFDMFEVGERMESLFFRVSASIQDAFTWIGEAITNTVNQALDTAAIAAQALGQDTAGTALSPEAMAQRRAEQATRFVNANRLSTGYRAAASEADRRGDAIDGARSTFATGTNPFVTAANAQTSIAANQVAQSKSVNVQSRNQVTVTGVVRDEEFLAKVQDAIRTVTDEANAKALNDLVDEGD